MAERKRGSRSTDNGERERTAAATDAATLTTAAGAMTLGLLTGAAAQQREQHDLSRHAPAAASSDIGHLTHDGQAGHPLEMPQIPPTLNQAIHGGAAMPSETYGRTGNDPAAGSPDLMHDQTATADAPTPIANEPAASDLSTPVIQDMSHHSVDDHGGLSASPVTPEFGNLSGYGTLDAVVTNLQAELSSTSRDLSDALYGLTNSLPNPGAIASTLQTTLQTTFQSTFHGALDAAAGIADSVMKVPAAAAGTLIGSAFGNAPTLHEATQATPSLFDSSDLMPVQHDLPPLHIGFTGQAHAAADDAVDGAFSALGLHHF